MAPMEIVKRAFPLKAFAAFALTLAAAGLLPGHAQAQNLAFCAYDLKGSTICAFYTHAQCMAYITGIGGVCSANPFLKSKTDSAKSERTKTETANTENVNAERAKMKAAKAERAKAEHSAKAEREAKAERTRAERRQAERQEAAAERLRHEKALAKQESSVETREPRPTSTRTTAEPMQSSAAAPIARASDAISDPIAVSTRAQR